ncbi:MAG: SGNH/GDSL hydrolase family protein [Lachnospiraceae bacterium]|nr:SGNH/GDSL hydrolase family protein [Lachnospiraceae bacterium]
MSSEKERLKRLQTMRRIALNLIVIVLVFTVGVVVGRQAEKRYLSTKDIVEEGSTEVVEATTEEVVTEAVTEISTEEAVDNTVSENTVSENRTQDTPKPKWNFDYAAPADKLKLADHAAIRSSYDETVALNLADKEVINNSSLDFSNMKIACLGDSITQGVGGATPYPEYLKEILGAKEVVNLGIGGSTVCSDHDDGVQAMSDRMDQIPSDTDLAIIIGGTNDNFYQAEWQFGFLYWDSKGDGTFCGDMQLLMRRFKWLFPDMRVIFFTPPSNTKIDELKAENPSLLDQSRYAEATTYIGAEEGMPVVDLFNENFLNAHDANVSTNLMQDEVHFNSQGNEILATRIASEIIKRYQ